MAVANAFDQVMVSAFLGRNVADVYPCFRHVLLGFHDRMCAEMEY